ncbi:O-antigen ligase family protein [Marinilactibacillus psychrotolerans]|uniref:O-antigen ligase family protein n=1 Tax=Marinilactibacillus psychrotolerans TaxID=191770 RepID=UPI003887D077
MINSLIIFIAMSLGVLTEISVGPLLYKVDIIEPVLIIIGISILINLWNKNKLIKIPKILLLLMGMLLVIFLYSLIAVNWTNYGLTVIPGALVFFYGTISLFIAYHSLERKEDVYILASRIFVLLIIIQLFINFSLGLRSGVTGFYDLKDFARTLIGKSNFISIFISFDLIYEFISKHKHWLFFFLIDLIAIIVTISRGAIVSLVLSIGLFFVVALFNRNFSKKNLLLSLSFLVIVATCFMLATSPGRELLSGLSAGLGASTVGSRQELWVEAFNETLLNPLGVGVVWKNDPHNFLFSSLRNLGFIFGTLYILLISSPFFILLHPIVLKLSKKSIAILMAYSSVFIHSFIEVFYFTNLSVTWTMFTLIYIFLVIKKDIITLRETRNKDNEYNEVIFQNYQKKN